MNLRTASPTDAPRIAALHAASWRSAYRGILADAYLSAQADADRSQLWHARLAHPSERQYVLLAERDDGLVGFVCVLLDEEPAWGACLDNLHVRPGLTGHGLGRALLGAAARWLRSVEPAWPLHLWVFEANDGARRFYERTGAELVERSRKLMPDGEAHVVLRYVWRDLASLGSVQ